MFAFLFDFLGAFTYGSNTSLDTRKIDKNIELLKQQDWFKRIYEDEKYHRLFFTNRTIRVYLQSTYRVKRIVRNELAQEKLLNLLDKHSRK
ncbi:hypothetical protein [Bacillus sp. MRMR6]|uniref:hypothetical protein n=1 Tax=Bacillus sp. MRMR6 TaxID=1928617 RepID=UPI00095363A3|nr:hypothetical protein [Bacillus sp. MRMR6]OLS34468.1 hypothetical protein BTR25_21835 [Bacillus sp. MRMR6]